MRHFVQYHNPDRMGPYDPSDPGLAIVTNKSIKGLKGQTVWLIASMGSPRKYHLSSWFVVEDVERLKSGTFLHRVAGGSQGRNLPVPNREISQLSWFPKLLKKCGNFRFGLVEVTDGDIIAGFAEIRSAYASQGS